MRVIQHDRAQTGQRTTERRVSLSFFWLFFHFVFFALAYQTEGDAQHSNPDPERAKQLVKNALDAEAMGQVSQRDQWLSQAVTADPDNQLARWYNGELLQEKPDADAEWIPIAQAEALASSDPILAKYQAARQTTQDDLSGNEFMAQWCKRNGLVQRERAHWTRVLQLQPGHRKAISNLGLKNYLGRWLTRDQISAIKQQQRDLALQQKEWRPVVTRWKRGYSRKDLLEKAAIHRDIKHNASPEIVSLLESMLSPVDEALSLVVVEAIDRVPQQVATESLLRHAVFSKWPSVRHDATRRLKQRSPHGYVPILINAMLSPLEFQSWNVHSAFDGDQVLAMNYAIYQQGKHVDRRVEGAVDFIGAGDSDSADEAREELIDQVAAVNLARERFNRPLAQILQSTTGQDFEANPVQWNDWWNDYNEYQVPDYRPVMTSFRRPSRVVVATRPFACFPAGTLVATETGMKTIEEIRVGDLVLSQNAVTGELRYQPVLETTVRESNAILNVWLENEMLRVTRGHPMWVNGQQWQMAKQLQPGSHLHGVSGPVTVRQLQNAGIRTQVYNLVVDQFHTYFVGQSRVLVHDNTLYTPPGVSVPGMSP